MKRSHTYTVISKIHKNTQHVSNCTFTRLKCIFIQRAIYLGIVIRNEMQCLPAFQLHILGTGIGLA